MKKRRIKPCEAVSFTNDLGHVIQPGDQVLIITSHYKKTRIGVGRYVGLRERAAVVEFDEVHEKTVHNENGSIWRWEAPGLESPKSPPYVNTWNATPAVRAEVQRAAEEHRETYNQYHNALEAYKVTNYHVVKTPYVRRSTLQLNRIFPFSMKASELVGKSV